MGWSDEVPASTALWFSSGSVLFFDTVLVVFLLRKDVYPISGRMSALSATAMMCTQFHLVVSSALRLVDASCLARWAAAFVLLSAFLLTYVFRAWILFYRAELTHEALDHQRKVRARRRTVAAEEGVAPVAVDVTDDEWYYKHREWISPLYVGLLFSAAFLLWIVIASAVVASGREDDYCDGRTAFVAFTSMWSVQCVAFLAAAFILRNVIDGFFIRAELLVTGAAAVVAFLGLTLTERDSYAYFFGGQFVPFAVVGLAVVVLPAALTFRDDGGTGADDDADEEAAGTDSLQQVLSFRAGREAFMAYIKGEFSTENLLFWQAVEGFRRQSRRALLGGGSGGGGDGGRRHSSRVSEEDGSPAVPPIPSSSSRLELIGDGAVDHHPGLGRRSDSANLSEADFAAAEDVGVYTPDTQWAHACLIYDDYVRLDGRMPVNLPGGVSRALKAVFSSKRRPNCAELAAVFDEAQEAIFNLMRRDSFPRFQRHHSYSVLADRVAERAARADRRREELHARSIVTTGRASIGRRRPSAGDVQLAAVFEPETPPSEGGGEDDAHSDPGMR